MTIDWEFFTLPLIISALIPLLSAPMGCVLIWRRMTFFGDTLAHSALFGLALGLLLDISLELTVIVACLVLAVILVRGTDARGLFELGARFHQRGVADLIDQGGLHAGIQSLLS